MTLLPVVFRGFTEASSKNADVRLVKCGELLRGVFVDVTGKVRVRVRFMVRVRVRLVTVS